MNEKLRGCMWQMWFPDKKTNCKSKNFWKGLSNRIKKNTENKRETCKRRLLLLEKARKVEAYCCEFPGYLTPPQSPSEEELLDEYICEKKLQMDILGQLGGGAFGCAYLALDKSRERFLCIKIIDRTQLMERVWELDIDIEKRVGWAKGLREVFHDEIIAIYDFFENLGMYAFQMEYFPGISLTGCWKRALQWDLKTRLVLLEKILQGIKCLHLFGWAHRDLHAGNILVDVLSKRDIKIIDFDLSRKGDFASDTIMGAGTQAPERFDKEGKAIFWKAMDVWAFGDLAYKLLAGIEEPGRMIAHDKRKFPSELDGELRETFAAALDPKPNQRPSAREIHRQILSFYQRYVFVESATLHQRLNAGLFYLSEGESGKITTVTENGNAKIFFRDGKVADARYGKIRGREVLEEVCDESKLLKFVDLELNTESIPENCGVFCFASHVKELQDPIHESALLGFFQKDSGKRITDQKRLEALQLSLDRGNIPQKLALQFSRNGLPISANASVDSRNDDRGWWINDGNRRYAIMTVRDFPVVEIYDMSFNMTDFFLKQASENDTFRLYRDAVKDIVCTSLGITGEDVFCRGEGCKNKRWTFENLLYGSDVFLYARDRHRLAPWCSECIKRDAATRTIKGPRLSANYRDYATAYLSCNPCAQFYLGIKRQNAKNFILYLKPPGLKGKKWDSILSRLKRGYDILGDYPCRHFTNFRHFHPIKIKEEKFVLLAQEYFPGVYLRQILNDKKVLLDDKSKTMILFDLARALEALHGKGVVHRNINLTSIMLGINGQIKLADFSLCKYEPGSPEEEDHLQVTANLTKPDLGGVLPYCSPEHLMNMALVTPKSDVWSWGVVAYKLLSGALPFKRKTVRQELHAIHHEHPNTELLPAALKSLVETALERDVNNRIDSRELVIELRKLL